MKKLNCLIIDDERLARVDLIDMLSSFKNINVLGQAGNGMEAIDMITKEKPDLIFLDIEMPDISGFEVLERLTNVPNVIFVSAYDKYALKAFDVNALDYVVKPINSKRLEKAISKYTNVESNSPANDTFTLSDQVFVKDRDKCYFIKIASISYIKSEGNYARIIFDGQKTLIKKSLNLLEQKLPQSHFFRCNRSEIINLNSIRKIDPMFKGTLRIHLHNGIKVDLSDRKSILFKDRMSL